MGRKKAAPILRNDQYTDQRFASLLEDDARLYHIRDQRHPIRSVQTVIEKYEGPSNIPGVNITPGAGIVYYQGEEEMEHAFVKVGERYEKRVSDFVDMGREPGKPMTYYDMGDLANMTPDDEAIARRGAWSEDDLAFWADQGDRDGLGAGNELEKGDMLAAGDEQGHRDELHGDSELVDEDPMDEISVVEEQKDATLPRYSAQYQSDIDTSERHMQQLLKKEKLRNLVKFANDKDEKEIFQHFTKGFGEAGATHAISTAIQNMTINNNIVNNDIVNNNVHINTLNVTNHYHEGLSASSTNVGPKHSAPTSTIPISSRPHIDEVAEYQPAECSTLLYSLVASISSNNKHLNSGPDQVLCYRSDRIHQASYFPDALNRVLLGFAVTTKVRLLLCRTMKSFAGQSIQEYVVFVSRADGQDWRVKPGSLNKVAMYKLQGVWQNAKFEQTIQSKWNTVAKDHEAHSFAVVKA